jgi:pimeloyl-ACP methyl ester carboxylesterase
VRPGGAGPGGAADALLEPTRQPRQVEVAEHRRVLKVVISGKDDRATPVELQAAIAAAVPAAEHEIVAPAAHLAAVEQPGRVNQLIGAHLR